MKSIAWSPDRKTPRPVDVQGGGGGMDFHFSSTKQQFGCTDPLKWIEVEVDRTLLSSLLSRLSFSKVAINRRPVGTPAPGLKYVANHSHCKLQNSFVFAV